MGRSIVLLVTRASAEASRPERGFCQGKSHLAFSRDERLVVIAGVKEPGNACCVALQMLLGQHLLAAGWSGRVPAGRDMAGIVLKAKAVLAVSSGAISPVAVESGSTHACRPGFAPGSWPDPSQAVSLPALFGPNQIVDARQIRLPGRIVKEPQHQLQSTWTPARHTM